MTPGNERPVILFDGVCNLCNKAVQFIIRHDKRQLFLFASLQSAFGIQAVHDVARKVDNVPDSIVLLYRNRYYYRSGAVLQIAKLLGGFLVVVWYWLRIAAYGARPVI